MVACLYILFGDGLLICFWLLHSYLSWHFCSFSFLAKFAASVLALSSSSLRVHHFGWVTFHCMFIGLSVL